MKTFDEIYEFSRMVEGNSTEDHLCCTATKAELKAFIPHVMALPKNSCVLEIGTYTGRSTSVYFQLQEELNLDIHLIDCLNWDANRAVEHFWRLVIDHFNDVPFTYHKMFSKQLFPRWPRSIDFLYIDGAHESPLVNFDFDNWPKYLKSGGILAAHDSHYPDIIPCLKKLEQVGWELLVKAERLTIWRKP